MSEDHNRIVAIFRTHSQPDRRASKEKGRPIFKDIEVCEIRMAANRQTVGVFPAHDIWRKQETEFGDFEPVTYAMRFPEQYKKFKAGMTQAQSGTPLEELTMIPQAKRLELKALAVHTVEALAALDGQELKNLGVGGRDLKNLAQAYLDKAKGNANVSKLASENETLKTQMAEMQAQIAALSKGKEATGPVASSPFFDMDADGIKEWIADVTGSRPKGNPNHETLVRMADEINEELKAKKEEAA